MFRWLFKLLGREYVRCKVCNKWTEPSIIFGSVCSTKCLDKVGPGNVTSKAIKERWGKC